MKQSYPHILLTAAVTSGSLWQINTDHLVTVTLSTTKQSIFKYHRKSTYCFFCKKHVFMKNKTQYLNTQHCAVVWWNEHAAIMQSFWRCA